MCPSANRAEDGLNRSSVRYLFLEEYLIDLGGSSRIFTRPPYITYGKCMVWIGIGALFVAFSPCCSKQMIRFGSTFWHRHRLIASNNCTCLQARILKLAHLYYVSASVTWPHGGGSASCLLILISSTKQKKNYLASRPFVVQTPWRDK